MVVRVAGKKESGKFLKIITAKQDIDIIIRNSAIELRLWQL
jgi:hypothetical protein